MDKIEEIRAKVNDIHTAIAGNAALGTKGIIHTLDEHNVRLEVLEKSEKENKKLKNQAKGAFVGGGFMAGAFGWPALKGLLIKIGFLIP